MDKNMLIYIFALQWVIVIVCITFVLVEQERENNRMRLKEIQEELDRRLAELEKSL